MLTAFLAASSVTFMAAYFALGIQGHERLAFVASLMVQVCSVILGLVTGNYIVLSVGIAGIAALLYFRRKPPRNRKRRTEAIGNKALAIRARLTARQEDAGGTRHSPQPQSP
jgi:hypothetical protein